MARRYIARWWTKKHEGARYFYAFLDIPPLRAEANLYPRLVRSSLSADLWRYGAGLSNEGFCVKLWFRGHFFRGCIAIVRRWLQRSENDN